MADMKKVALATLLFAMLLASSTVQAARPIVAEGEAVAADGSLMLQGGTHSRQLKLFFGWWPFRGCGWFWWGGCAPRYYVQPVPVEDDHDRRLQSVSSSGRRLQSVSSSGRRLNFLFFKSYYTPYFKFWWYKPVKVDYDHRRQLRTLGIFWDWVWAYHAGYSKFCWFGFYCRFHH